MKNSLLILLIFLLSCSNDKKTDNGKLKELDNSSISIINDIDRKKQITENSKYKFNCITIEEFSNILEIDKDKIQLTEKDIKEREYKKVDEEFYRAYIKGNKLFRKWNISKEEDYWDTKHYYWGTINEESNCLIIIYEYFTLDDSENKLFLLNLDNDGDLINTLQVGELTHYAGATQKIYTIIKKKEMKIFSVLNGVLGEFNKETKQYKYASDSIITKYDIENWNQIRLIDSDTLKTEYWE